MNLFNLLNEDLLNTLVETSDDKNNNVVINKLDFTNKEDVKTLLDAIDEFKNPKNNLTSLIKTCLGGKEFDKVLDTVADFAKTTYENSTKKVAAVDMERKEVDNSLKDCKCCGKKVCDCSSRPSSSTPEENKQQIAKLVADYLDEKIIPAAKLTDKQLTSVADGLFEFACWIYNR